MWKWIELGICVWAGLGIFAFLCGILCLRWTGKLKELTNKQVICVWVISIIEGPLMFFLTWKFILGGFRRGVKESVELHKSLADKE